MVKMFDSEDDLIDLGAASEKTHGHGGSVQPDSPLDRAPIGIIAD